jgi:hypothetical protein
VDTELNEFLEKKLKIPIRNRLELLHGLAAILRATTPEATVRAIQPCGLEVTIPGATPETLRICFTETGEAFAELGTAKEAFPAAELEKFLYSVLITIIDLAETNPELTGFSALVKSIEGNIP